MDRLLRVYLKESCYKATERIYYCVYISRKVVIKLKNGYITGSTSQRNLLLSYGMYISLRVHLKESRYKVTECIYHCEYISKIVVIKLRNVYITASTSQGKLL